MEKGNISHSSGCRLERRAFRTNGRAIGETPLKYRIGLWARIIIFTIYLPRTCACSILPVRGSWTTSVRVKYRWNEVPDNVSLEKKASCNARYQTEYTFQFLTIHVNSPNDERILRFLSDSFWLYVFFYFCSLKAV